MIQLFADDRLIYDSRLPELKLLGLEVTLGLNKGGTVTVTLPPDHPYYNVFTSYRTVVTVYRDGVLLFRGRALYPTDDFLLRRTITCEGERCFLRDGTMRPYLYQGDPAVIFADIIGLYNAQVDAFKQFKVGTVDVSDPNDYIRLESESAESFADVLDKLVDRVGGYIIFTTNAEGKRIINWRKAVGYANNQVIELGSNLLDFQRTTANSELATVIFPYGAKDETTGKRVTIESVNNGLDYIKDDEALALRGWVSLPVYWDDVTEPANLLTKAQQYLATSKNLITSLELTALDLSLIDKTVDCFRIGDVIKVRSQPHGMADDDTNSNLYQLNEQSLDLLNPKNDKIVLGKSVVSLIGADVAANRHSTNEIQRVERRINTSSVEAQIEAAKKEMTSLIEQTSDEILLAVAEEYTTSDEVTARIETSMTQLSDSFEFMFNELRTVVDANDAEARVQFEEIYKYIRFEEGNIILGESGNEITLRIENDRISFLDAGAEVAYFSNKQLHVLDGAFLNSLRIGRFAFIPRENGNLSLVKVGG